MTHKKILVGVAWPYVNGEKHIGQIAGAYLPPDIFARYQRLIGNDVLMVSGSDTHGTPIMLKADAEGVSYDEVIDKYHTLFVDGCLEMGLTFDLYTHTDTAESLGCHAGGLFAPLGDGLYLQGRAGAVV